MAFAAGDVLTAAGLNNAVRKAVARANRVSNSTASASTTEVGVLRLDDIPLLGGHSYRIAWSLNFDVTTNADSMRALLRYTNDSSTPSTASTILPGSGGEAELTDNAIAEHLQVDTSYTPASNELFSCLLTIRHNQGTSVSIAQADASVFHTQIWIDDMGDDPGDTGTDI